jgi:hypothetical protein
VYGTERRERMAKKRELESPIDLREDRESWELFDSGQCLWCRSFEIDSEKPEPALAEGFIWIRHRCKKCGKAYDVGYTPEYIEEV